MVILWFTDPFISYAGPQKNKPTTAPQPIQEMFQSDLVYPQEEDEVRLTLFPSFRKDKETEKARTLFEVEYGITDALQVICEWYGLLYQNPDEGPTHSGLGNIELGGAI